MRQGDTEAGDGASRTVASASSPTLTPPRSRPGTGGAASQPHRPILVDEANGRSDLGSLHVLGERIPTPLTRPGSGAVRLGSARGTRPGSAASQRPRCEPRPTAVIPCSPELTPQRTVTKERRAYAVPCATSEAQKSGSKEGGDDKAEQPSAAAESPRARRRGGAHTLLLRQTYNGRTKVLFEDGHVKEYASDHIDHRIAGRLASHSTTSSQTGRQHSKQAAMHESSEGQHDTLPSLEALATTPQLTLPEVLPATDAHDPPLTPPKLRQSTTPPPSARSTSAASQEPPSAATTPARTSRASSQQIVVMATTTPETTPREAESLSWGAASPSRGVVVVMTPPLPSHGDAACAADDEQQSTLHAAAAADAATALSHTSGQTRSTFLTGVEVDGAAQPMPRPSSLIATRCRRRLSSLSQQQRPTAHVMGGDPEEMAQLRAEVRQLRAAQRAAAQRFLQPDAPSLFSIPLPPMPAGGGAAGHGDETGATTTTSNALRLPYGLTVFGLFQRLVSREQGALRSKLSGLDITRFMQQSSSASELVVHFFWYVVVHCRRAWLERLLVGRHGRLVAAYQELFAQGRKERLPSLHVLENLVQELLCCNEAWQRQAQERADSLTTMTSLLQVPSTSVQPVSTSGPRPASMSTVVRYKGVQRIYDFLVDGGYTTVLSLPKLYSGGSLPEVEAVDTLCATLDRLQCARAEYNELMAYSECLYRRMASLFGDIFLQLSSSEKDIILESYGIVVVRITYYTLLLCFPNDTHANLFHADFRADLSRLYHYWTSGLVETHVPVRGWPTPQPEDFAELSTRCHRWPEGTAALVMPPSMPSVLLLPALTSKTAAALSRGDQPTSASDAASIELAAVRDVGRPASSRHDSASNTGERADEGMPEAAASWLAEGQADSAPLGAGTTAPLPGLAGSFSPVRRRHTQTMAVQQQQGCSVTTPRATSRAREDVDFDEIDPNVVHGECRLTSEFARYARHAAGLVLELERRTTRQHRRQMRKLQRPRRSLVQASAQPQSAAAFAAAAAGPYRQQSARRPSQITLDVQLLSSPLSPGEQGAFSPAGSDTSTVAPRSRGARSARAPTARRLSQPTQLAAAVASHPRAPVPVKNTTIATSTSTTASGVAAVIVPPAMHHASMSTQSVASSSLLSHAIPSRRSGGSGGRHRRAGTQAVTTVDGGAQDEGMRVTLPAVTRRVVRRRQGQRESVANGATRGSTSWTPRQQPLLPGLQHPGSRHNTTSTTAARGAAKTSATLPETQLHEKLQAIEVRRARISVTKDTATTDLVRLASTLKQQSTMPVQLRGSTGVASTLRGSDTENEDSHGGTAAVVVAGSSSVFGEGLLSATPDDGCASLLTSFPLALCESGTRAYLMYAEGVRYPNVPLPSAVATAVLHLQPRLGGITGVSLSRPVSSTRPTTASSSLTTHVATATMLHVMAGSTLDFNNTLYTEDTYEDVHRAEDWAEGVAAAVAAALKRSTVVRRTRLPSASPFMRHYATHVLHLASYTTGPQEGGECASRHGGRAVQQGAARHASPLSDDEDDSPRAPSAARNRRQRTFRGVGRATREKTRLQVITREDGLHRPLLYTEVGRQALAQQKALLQDMGRVSQRDAISRHAYTINHIKTVCDMRETSSDAATLRYRRIARHRLELRLVDTSAAVEGAQELAAK